MKYGLKPQQRPQVIARGFGREIKQIRLSRGWSRSEFLARFHDVLEADDPDYTIYSEAWLGRLERGDVAKFGELSRDIIEALLRTLNCSSWERSRCYLFADRNALLSHSYEATPVALVFHHHMIALYTETQEILATSLGNCIIDDLTEDDTIELFENAVGMVLNSRRISRTD